MYIFVCVYMGVTEKERKRYYVRVSVHMCKFNITTVFITTSDFTFIDM